MIPIDPSLKRYFNVKYFPNGNFLVFSYIEDDEIDEEFKEKFYCQEHASYNENGDITNEAIGYRTDSRIIICDNCGGQGRHLLNSMRNVAYTSEDIAEDPEFFENMQSGYYDQTCNICEGTGRLLTATDKKLLDYIYEFNKDSYDWDAESERRYFGEY